MASSRIASLAAQATHVERLLSPAWNDCFAPSRETVQGRDAPVGRDSRVVDRPGQTDLFSRPMTLQRVDAEY
jgi:hypothetical protein